MPSILGRRKSSVARVVRAPIPERAPTAVRGYDNLWRKVSERHRKRFPFCAPCGQNGRQRLADAVDHKIPISDGGDRLKAGNRWSICDSCHNGFKRQLEIHARNTDQIEKLTLWCDEPLTRPRPFWAFAISGA